MNLGRNFVIRFFMAAILLLLAHGAAPGASGADLSPTPSDTWVVDGDVNAIVRTADTNYPGGNFTGIARIIPYGAPVDSASGLPGATYPKVNGFVDCCAPDGAGGWYIGGDFYLVGAFTRYCLAHIKSNGTVDGARIFCRINYDECRNNTTTC